MGHPCYRLLNQVTGQLGTSYFEESPRRENDEEFDAEMELYRCTLSDILNALVDAGFVLEEP